MNWQYVEGMLLIILTMRVLRGAYKQNLYVIPLRSHSVSTLSPLPSWKLEILASKNTMKYGHVGESPGIDPP